MNEGIRLNSTDMQSQLINVQCTCTLYTPCLYIITIMIVPIGCRKIKLIEGSAKCHHLNKFTCKGTLRQVFICLWPKTPGTPYLVYILIHTERGWGELIQIKGQRGNSSQSLIDNTKITDCISFLKTLINTRLKDPLQMTTFCFGVYIVNQSMRQVNKMFTHHKDIQMWLK